MALERKTLDRHWSALRPTLLAHATQYTHPQEAEDRVQETYLLAVSILDRYTAAEDPRTLTRWLCRIVAYLCHNHSRVARHRQRLADRLLQSQLQNQRTEEDPFSDLTPRIQALGHRRAEIWQMWRCGLTQSEMALALGISQPAVSKHVTRIIEELRVHQGELITRHDGYHNAQDLFHAMSAVDLYIRPQRTGAGLSNARLRRLK